jgi:hypothetical protein
MFPSYRVTGEILRAVLQSQDLGIGLYYCFKISFTQMIDQ